MTALRTALGMSSTREELSLVVVKAGQDISAIYSITLSSYYRAYLGEGEKYQIDFLLLTL
jgi:hypothetical protein